MPDPDVRAVVRKLASEAKHASGILASASTARKNAVLRRVAEALRGPAGAAVLVANERDLGFAQDLNLSADIMDRLRLDGGRIGALADDVEAVRCQPDPVGRIEALEPRASGLRTGRMSVPLGLIALIYESRPEVAVHAAALCIKSGNALVLRGGKEAFHSSEALVGVFVEALRAEGLPEASVSWLPTSQREAVRELVALDDLVDLAIPRGSDGLLRYVAEHARVPLLRPGRGVCHVYVDESAQPELAERIVVNAKTSRMGAGNAAETLLVARALAPVLVPRIGRALTAHGIALRGDEETRALYPEARLTPPPDYDVEHLGPVLSVRVVSGYAEAVEHIARHGTRHTETIVTEDYGRAQRFVRDVDASAVLVNASTRFNDGAELGLGVALGVSSTKLHAYGPIGLAELCTKKWIVYGDGQVR